MQVWMDLYAQGYCKGIVTCRQSRVNEHCLKISAHTTCFLNLIPSLSPNTTELLMSSHHCNKWFNYLVTVFVS
jgi:hypothetical protein